MGYRNGARQNWEFDNRKRISHITINSAAKTLNDLHYTLNADGDILAINNNEYEYDGFDRIVKAKTQIPGKPDYYKLVTEHFGTFQDKLVAGKTYEPLADLDMNGRINGVDHIIASFEDPLAAYDLESFTYDENGNRTGLVQNGDEYSYVYGERNRLEEITVKKKGENTVKDFALYEYDANGNTTKRTLYTAETPVVTLFGYDTLNRLVRTETNGEETLYSYDNAGNRLLKKDPDGTLTLYLRHGQIAVAMDIEVEPTGGEDAGRINRYVLSGDLLAGRVTTTKHADGTGVIDYFYYHLDHLNSTKCVTDETGNLVVNYEYRAFGEQLKRLDAAGQETEDKAKYSYIGKELDEETNLYYFNARYYDATIGRFINVDPIQDGTNWYVYCSNNPLSMVDPTGLGNEIPIYGARIKTVWGENKVNLTKDDLVFIHELTRQWQHSYFQSMPDIDARSATDALINLVVGAIPVVGTELASLHTGALGLMGIKDNRTDKAADSIRFELDNFLLGAKQNWADLNAGKVNTTMTHSFEYVETLYRGSGNNFMKTLLGKHVFSFNFQNENGQQSNFNITLYDHWDMKNNTLTVNPVAAFLMQRFSGNNVYASSTTEMENSFGLGRETVERNTNPVITNAQ
jgi:RHS repeat-associated protein